MREISDEARNPTHLRTTPVVEMRLMELAAFFSLMRRKGRATKIRDRDRVEAPGEIRKCSINADSEMWKHNRDDQAFPEYQNQNNKLTSGDCCCRCFSLKERLEVGIDQFGVGRMYSVRSARIDL